MRFEGAAGAGAAKGPGFAEERLPGGGGLEDASCVSICSVPFWFVRMTGGGIGCLRRDGIRWCNSGSVDCEVKEGLLDVADG
jgi:hypothetical protein